MLRFEGCLLHLMRSAPLRGILTRQYITNSQRLGAWSSGSSGKLHRVVPDSNLQCQRFYLRTGWFCTDTRQVDNTPLETQTERPSARHRDMGIVFTCGKCDTRAVKTFSRQSYEQGLVMVRCPGCQGMHLIADHLGWFGENFKIEDFLKQRGEQVTKTTSAALESLSPGDLIGWSRVQRVMAAVSEARSAQNKPVEGASQMSPALTHEGATGLQSATQLEEPEDVLELTVQDVEQWTRAQAKPM